MATSQSHHVRRLAAELNNAGVLFFHLNNLEYASCRFQESLQIRMRLDEAMSGPRAQSEHGMLRARYEETRREVSELRQMYTGFRLSEAPLLDLYPIAGLEDSTADLIHHHEKEEHAPMSPLLIPATQELLSAEDGRNVATTLFNIGLVHYKHDSVKTATKYFEMALDQLEKSKCAFLMAIILNTFAKVEYQRGKLTSSMDLLRDALKCHQTLGKAPQDKFEYFTVNSTLTHRNVLADKFSLMGRIHFVMGNASMSLDLSLEALRLRRKSMHADHMSFACSLWNTGLALALRKDTQAAIEHIEEFIRVCQGGMGAVQTGTASCLPQLALAQHAIGLIHLENYAIASAVDSFKSALKLRQHAFGDDHPIVAESYIKLARVMHETGRYQEALNLCSKSLRIQRSYYGQQSREAGVVLCLLGSIHQDIGDLDKALVLYEEALKTARLECRDETSFVANTLEAIGKLHLDRGCTAEAIANFADSAKIRQQLDQEESHENSSSSFPSSNCVGGECALPKTLTELMQSYRAAAAA